MNDTGAALSNFTFTSGVLRGTQLTLHASALVHRSAHALETIPLAAITAVSVAFRRNERRLVWGIGLIVFALLFLVIAGPLGSFASSAASAGQQSLPIMQHIYRVLEALASLLPVLPSQPSAHSAAPPTTKASASTGSRLARASSTR